MDIEQFTEYCLSKPYVYECFPFDEYTMVFKVGNKMFAFLPLEKSFAVTLKSDPEKSIILMEKYLDIMPGYHCNKKHWITVNVTNNISDGLLKELTDSSYELVLKSLTKKIRDEYKIL